MRRHNGNHADVLVVGGGPSGICAALGAAQTGAEVTLLEKAGFLGGTATGGMVAAFNGFFWDDIQVTAGAADQIVQKLVHNGGSHGFRDYTAGELTASPLSFKVLAFDPEVLKLTLDDLMLEAGVRVVHHVQAIEPITEGSRVDAVRYAGPVDTGAMSCTQVVDATGHGSLAIAAGAPAMTRDRGSQPMTLMMRVSDVDIATVRAVDTDKKRRLIHHGVDTGRLFYRTLAMSTSPRNGDAFLLMTNVHGLDGTNPFDLSAAEIEGRRQARLTIAYLRENFPGFERAEISQLAPWIGVRETRRVQGRTTLSAAAVMNGEDHPEAISYGAGPIDRHDKDSVRLVAPPRPFAVPFGVLCPRGLENVLVAGRAVSAAGGAMDGLRHMGGVMPLGHAAGVAAAKAFTQPQLTPHLLDVAEIRRELRRQGAIVDDPVTNARSVSP